jgi:predicted  nucleic acid-binding Zn-ribbon protein
VSGGIAGKEGLKMEGKELWKLFDFIKKLRDKAEKVEKDAPEAMEPKERNNLKEKIDIYKETAQELEDVLRNLILDP